MSMVVTMASGWHVAVLPLFMAVMGFLGSASATLFSLVSGHFDRSLTGRASTALNLLVFLGAFVFQWGIGVVIGFWGGANAGAYPAEGYQVAFGSLATLQAMMVFNDRKLAT
ncbi:hypothetical protein [Marinobacter salexigens]|uniref:MFS transporter n=1 Tax=Marinobacter salexigens TaxID=1925763 RepID=A0ABS6A4Q5_9GAMM|nr:hypothetical protein [Marinobacter salexigens]MBU2872635.1 hypothetical protein [Marinobacter salexigens]